MQNYAESLTETGSAARIAARLNDTAAGAIKRLQSMTESLAISVGSILLPQIVELLDTIIPVIESMRIWAEAHPELTSMIFKLTTGLLFFRLGSIALRWVLFSMLTPILQIIRAASWLLVLLPRLGRALLALLNPLKLVRAALIAIRLAFLTTGIGALLAGVAMAGIWIYNNWEGLQSFFVGFWRTFREALGPAAPMLDAIIDYARQIWEWFTDLLGPMDATEEQWLSWGQNAGEALGQVVGNVARWIEENKGLISTVAKLYAWFFALRLIWRFPMAPIRTAGRLLAWVANGPIKWLLRGVGLRSKAFLRLGLLVLTNPIGLIIAGIAALAYVVYDNWDEIVSFVIDKVDVVKAAFDKGLLKGVFTLLAEFNPFMLAIEGMQGLIAYVMDLVGVPEEIVAAFREFDLFETGVALMQSLWDGMLSLVDHAVASIVAKFASLKPQWLTDLQNWINGDDAPRERVSSEDRRASRRGRDRGGPVRAGMPYLVGERSPEIFVPGVSGTILPGRVLKAAMAASAMAAPVAAMPTQTEIVETLDRRPVMSAPATAPQITREGDTISINIYLTQGMSVEDIGREVERRLARREDARRADLHDGVDY